MSGVVSPGQKLFDLLPALYRIKDAQLAQAQNLTMGPLQSLLALVEEQLAVVAEDLDQLYDDQFIETCAPWVIPYIGDLIGYQAVNGVAAAVASPRAEVANTISFRRRKGTVLVLEQLARDVTGWGAHAVEFFKLLADTQYMNHIRPHNYYAPDLRGWGTAGIHGHRLRCHGAHGGCPAHCGGTRPLQHPEHWNFLWSLQAYSLTMSPAALVANTNQQCFRFSSLGRDMPLFNNPVSQGSEITALARPVNVADVLPRRVLCRDIRQIVGKGATPVYYGNGNSLALYLGGSTSPVNPADIQVCDLSGEDGHWNNVPAAGSAYSLAIDPELGRIALPPPAAGANPTVEASFYYGFNADMGGGEYSRAGSFAASPEQPVVRVPGDYPSISEALSALGGDGVVEIADSRVYNETGLLSIAVNANGLIELRAADGCRPTLFLGAGMSVTGGSGSTFDLNGLVVAYAPPSSGALLPAALIQVARAGRLDEPAQPTGTHALHTCPRLGLEAPRRSSRSRQAHALGGALWFASGGEQLHRGRIVGQWPSHGQSHGQHRRCGRRISSGLRGDPRCNGPSPARRRLDPAGLHGDWKSLRLAPQLGFKLHLRGAPFRRRPDRLSATLDRCAVGRP